MVAYADFKNNIYQINNIIYIKGEENVRRERKNKTRTRNRTRG